MQKNRALGGSTGFWFFRYRTFAATEEPRHYDSDNAPTKLIYYLAEMRGGCHHHTEDSVRDRFLSGMRYVLPTLF